MPEAQGKIPSELEMLTAMGSAEFDAKAYFDSDTYQLLRKMPSNALMRKGASMDEIAAFWETQGLIREMHGKEDDPNSRWISYVPVRADGDHTVYPLLFVLHGAFNPITLAETYGYTELAARERLILIIPENEQADNITNLLEYAQKQYPVDESRVYCVGFSFGGMNTARITLRYPSVFAAAGMGGMVHASSTKGLEMTGVQYPAFELTDQLVQNARDHIMPACIFIGEQEVLEFAPLYRDCLGLDKDPERLVEPFPQAKLHAYNVWRRAGGCEPIAPDELAKGAWQSADIVENKCGTLFERTEVRGYDKRSYYIGDCVQPNGACNTRLICAAKSPHWVTNRMADLIWEHIGQFARNRQTGKSYRIGQTG